MTDDRDAIEARVDALERRLDAGPESDRIAELQDRLAELEAAVEALEGYVGEIERIDDDLERRADAALAAADDLEERIERLESDVGSDEAGSKRLADRTTNGQCPCETERFDRAAVRRRSAARERVEPIERRTASKPPRNGPEAGGSRDGRSRPPDEPSESTDPSDDPWTESVDESGLLARFRERL